MMLLLLEHTQRETGEDSNHAHRPSSKRTRREESKEERCASSAREAALIHMRAIALHNNRRKRQPCATIAFD